MKIQAHRYHDISAGHRVVGHESKCCHLHGHNYRVYFYCEALEEPCVDGKDHLYSVEHKCVKCGKQCDKPSLDSLGRVIDFSVIKEKLCMWLEDNWDHKFLFWENDSLIGGLMMRSPNEWIDKQDDLVFMKSFVSVPFNPTAENMAHYLLTQIAPKQLDGTGVVCTKVVIEETRKCAVTAEI